MITVSSLLLALLLQSSSIEGRVVKTGTSETISKATVELRAVSDDGVKYRVTTSDDGRFAFSSVKPGQYRIAVSASGYVSTEYGKRKASARGSSIELAADQRLNNLQVSLMPTGAISGRVIDNTGRPVVKAEVQAMKVSYQEGRRVFSPAQSAVTDDLGEYRLFWLPPGAYYVSAIGPIWGSNGSAIQIVIGPGAPVTGLSGYGGGTGGYNPLAPASLPDDRRSPDSRYETVYYPNTVDDQRAEPVDVPAGGEANANIVFSSFVRTRHVRVHVSDETNGPSPTQIRLTNLPTVVGNRGPNPYQASGTYETDISTAPTIISANAPFAPPVAPLPTVPLRLGRAWIPAGESDLDVQIAMKLGSNLTARLVVESIEPNGPKPGGFRVSLTTEPKGLVLPFQLPAQGTVSENGAFTLADVGEGDYHVNIAPILNLTATAVAIPAALQHAYVKSIRLGDVDVLNSVLHMPAPPDSSLAIVIGNNAATMTGTALNDKQEPDPDSTVVLVPVNRTRTDLYRFAQTDASGRFHLDRIPPGDYKIFAWDEVEPGAWQDPQFMQTFEERGLGIHVDEGGTVPDVRVTVIPS